MLTISIPGRGDLVLRHLLLDFNGTIAEDGRLAAGMAERLEALSRSLAIYVVTADTHGTAAAACAGLPVEVLTYPTVQVGDEVYTGTIIGSAGNTAVAESGRASHLHFAMYQDGQAVNPEDYLPEK